LPKPAVSESFFGYFFSKKVTSYFSVPSVAQIGLSGHAKANGIDKLSSLRMGDERAGARAVRRVIRYWRQGLATQNFGDYLSEVLLSGFRGGGLTMLADEPADLPFSALYLIGSVISDWHIRQGVSNGAEGRVGFWGCGLRQAAPPAPETLRHCRFMGVRGPLTREALRLPEETPIGDPALLLPTLYPPPVCSAFGGPSLCVPHFLTGEPRWNSGP
jgi:hypothetical protein